MTRITWPKYHVTHIIRPRSRDLSPPGPQLGCAHIGSDSCRYGVRSARCGYGPKKPKARIKSKIRKTFPFPPWHWSMGSPKHRKNPIFSSNLQDSDYPIVKFEVGKEKFSKFSILCFLFSFFPIPVAPKVDTGSGDTARTLLATPGGEILGSWITWSGKYTLVFKHPSQKNFSS